MIDLHCHILPGLDDGSESLEESLEMAREAVKEGIEVIAATPHHGNGWYWNEAEQVREAVGRLNEHLKAHHIPLTVTTGQEIRVYRELIEDYLANKLLPLNGSPYILLEFPSSKVPERVDELIHELHVRGLAPIIAHPERNAELVNAPEKLLELIRLGAFTQLTSHSINGLFGKKIRDISLSWCRMNLIHVVASDAHNVTSRTFGLKQAFETISNELGHKFVDYYQSNAQSILYAKDIETMDPKIVRKKWYEIWK